MDIHPAAHRVENPSLIPAKRYYDPEFFALEKDRLWPHTWQMACRVEQIPEVGDWIEYSNMGTSIIVVRTNTSIKAHVNTCRHRGVQLVEGSGNCRKQGIVCPFHGWRWNMDGENTFVYGRHFFDEDVLSSDSINLVSCRVEVLLGCVFINLDPHVPSLAEALGPLVERLDVRNVSQLRAEWWFATELPANWKTAMEAFMEGFHVMRTHPQLQQKLPSLYNVRYGMDTGGIGVPINPNQTVRENVLAQIEHMALISEGMGGQCHSKEVEIARGMAEVDLPEDPTQAIPTWFGMVQDRITQELRSRGEPVPDLNAVSVSHPLEAVEYIFPNYFLLTFFTSMISYRIKPLGPETCLFEIASLTFFPKGEEPKSIRHPTVLSHDSDIFPLIPRQDYSNIPAQQKGLHGTGFEYMRLAKGVEGLISNYNRIIDGYLSGSSFQSLADANRELVGNFDGLIKDLPL